MCGRYDLSDIDSIAEHFDVDIDDIELRPNHNVSPNQTMPVVVFDDATKRNKLRLMRWSIHPDWADKPLINARAEKIKTSRYWKDWLHCNVIANRFYEWHPTTRTPWAFGVKDQPLISLAGIYKLERLPDGTEEFRYVVLTTNPNETVKPIHPKAMAVILPPELEQVYISEPNDESMLHAIRNPYIDSLMTAEEMVAL